MATVNEFDAKAHAWDTPERIKRAATFAREISRAISLDPSWSVLELGAGTGLLSFNLVDRFAAVTMIDTSAGMVDVLRTKAAAGRIPHVRVELTDIESLAAAGEQFDFIYSAMVLHHIPDLATLFSAFASLLGPHGRIALIDLMREDGSFHGTASGSAVHHGFDPNTLAGTLSECGFAHMAWHVFYSITRLSLIHI